MGPYKFGQPINLVERFYLIDPITLVQTLADPTTVVFTLQDPNGDEVTFTFGLDTEVSNPSVGVYVCLIGSPDVPGDYTYECVGTGAVEASSGPRELTVLGDNIAPTGDTEVAISGPCSSWISGDNVADCDTDLGVGSDTWLLDGVAYSASHILFELTGRQYPGNCTRTVRPCRSECDCFDNASGLGWTWGWAMATQGWAGTNGAWGWGWRSEGGDRCGCGTLSKVRLSGYPVAQILEVKIDGVVLANDGTNFRLDNRRDLIRLASPGPPVVDNKWPWCQNLALPDTEPGTFSVTYTWGMDVPALGRAAAAQLARELWSACNTGSCALPSKVTRVVRQGVTIERVTSISQMLRSGSTGLQLVDAFIAITNPDGLRRRPAVWSPDVQQYARKVGQ